MCTYFTQANVKAESPNISFRRTIEDYELAFFWGKPLTSAVDRTTLGELADEGIRDLEQDESPYTECILTTLNGEPCLEDGYRDSHQGVEVAYRISEESTK